VQKAEGVGAEGTDHGVQVDPPDALERADHEGVGREQLAGGWPPPASKAQRLSRPSIEDLLHDVWRQQRGAQDWFKRSNSDSRFLKQGSLPAGGDGVSSDIGK
jgi:hypothetical protein